MIECEKIDYDKLNYKETLGIIGYEVSQEELNKKSNHTFLFDIASIDIVQNYWAKNKKLKFIIRPTIAVTAKNMIINWQKENSNDNIVLKIDYINKARQNYASVENAVLKIEKNMVKLSWDSPKNYDFVGYYVVRNRFHPPKNPYDGVKIYAGKDNYTYDKFGNIGIDKYYAIFTYDDVPNYSIPFIIEYKK